MSDKPESTMHITARLEPRTAQHLEYLVELGAAIKAASTTVPVLSSNPAQ
jgi:hypothetical protein